VLSDLRIDEGTQMVLELDVRSFFVQASQPAVATSAARMAVSRRSTRSLANTASAPPWYAW